MTSNQVQSAVWNHLRDEQADYVALRSKIMPVADDDLNLGPPAKKGDRPNAREILYREHQRNMSSCQGNGLTTMIENLVWMATGRIFQLSRMFAYIRTQMKDGIRDDSGSSLTGGIWVAMNEGLPLEKYHPYPPSYTRNIPREAEEHAPNCKLVEAKRLPTYEAIVDWLRQPNTSCYAGMGWNGNMGFQAMKGRKRVETFRPSGRGGHAIAFPQIVPETFDESEPDIDLHNSHGEGWGDGGCAAVSPRAIREMLDEPRTRMFGGFIGTRGVELGGEDFNTWS